MGNEFKENMSWLWKFYIPIKKRLIIITLQSVLVAILSAAIPFVFIKIIDGIEEKLSPEYIIKSVLLLLFLGLLNFLISMTNTLRRALTNLELEWQFRQKTFEKVINMDQDFYETFKTGDIITRLTDDVGEKLSWFACSGIFRAWESFLRIVFCLAAMTWINPLLALISIVPLPIQFLIYGKTRRLIDKRFKERQSVISRVSDTIQNCFSGIRIIQAYCMEEKQAEEFREIAYERSDAEVSAEKAHILVHSLFHHFWQITQILVLLAGGWMVIKGKLTIGEFVAFDYYVSHLVWPMFDISGLFIGYRKAAVSIKRLKELDEFVPAVILPAEPQTNDHGTGNIIFKNVTFNKNGKAILDNVSFDTGNHKMVALAGEIGSGKSTLLNLICRFCDPTEGEIIIDNIELKNWDIKALRNRIGYISQEPLLFTDSVKNNIKFGREIEDEKIISGAEISQIKDEVNSFSEGFNTSIGLRGMTISGGQKQRISIARALAGSPEILLMDDATAHLDAETENALWNHIYNSFPHMKIFLVSHRTATLEKADFILVLKDGKIVEKGRHKDLLEKKGEYYRLYSVKKVII